RRREKEDLRLRGQTGLPRIACRRSLVLVRGDANLQKTSMVSGFSRDRVERLGEVYAECPAPQDGVSSRPRGTARGDSPVKTEVCDLVRSRSLPPGPNRRALLEEGRNALLLVLGRKAEAEEIALVGEAVLERQPLARADRFLGDLERQGRERGDLGRQLQRLRAQLFVRVDQLDEADTQRFRGVDHLAREDQAHRLAGADQARQALAAAAAGDQAELDLRLAEA